MGAGRMMRTTPLALPVIGPTTGQSRRPRRRSLLAALAVGAVLSLFGAALATGFVGLETATPGVRLGTEAPATAMNFVAQPANNSPVVLADPTERRFVVLANRLDAPDFSCALQVSGDGGRSWLPANPVPELPAGAEKCYAPEVAFDKDGVLYYVFVGLHGAGNEPMGAFLATSTDRAVSFSRPRRVLGPLNFGVRMAIDPDMGRRGRVHLVWIHARSDPPLGGFPPGPNPILAAHSDDGGRTFSEPVQVSDPERARVVAPALALGADHRVHVAYYDLGDDARDYQGLAGPVWDGRWSVIVSTSLDGGRRFSSGAVVDDEVAPTERVMLIFTMAAPSVAAHGERVCVGWSDARHGDADVLLRCSQKVGTRWEGLLRLNDDRVNNGVRQYLPRLSFSPEGRLDVIFFDRRRDPTNASNDVFFTFSKDGGRDFAPARLLTTESSYAAIGQRYVGPAAEGQVEIGARLGLLSQRSAAVAAWPDTRRSLPGTGQDVFTRRIDGLSERRRPVWPRLAGAGLVLAALVILIVAQYRRRRNMTGEAVT